MDWEDLLAAFAIYLVLEGLLPFLTPRGWKQSIEMISRMPDGQLRMFGLVSMVAGALLLAFVWG